MHQLEIKSNIEDFTYRVGYKNKSGFVTIKTFDRFNYNYFQVRAWVMKLVCNEDNNLYTW